MKQGIFIPLSYVGYRIGKKGNIIPFPNSHKLRFVSDTVKYFYSRKFSNRHFMR